MVKCRICKEDTIQVVDLGVQFVSGFVEKENILAGDKAPLTLCLCTECGFLQLTESYPPDKMYSKYWYNSGLNEQMRAELGHVVDTCLKYRNVQPGDVVLDIASNDGYMLTTYPDELKRVGIDPCDVAWNSPTYTQKHGVLGHQWHNGVDSDEITLINDYFSSKSYNKFIEKKASIVTVCAMFYDLDDPKDFLEQVKEIMTEDGLLALQLNYMPLMLEQNDYPGICHEHVGFYSYVVLESLLEECGFNIVDVELNTVNGGSFIVFATLGAPERLSLPLHALSVGTFRKEALRSYESTLDLFNPQTYKDFMSRIKRLKMETIEWLKECKAKGKRVLALGASTKGNTMLQYYGITPDLLEAIAERSEAKFGKYTVGTGIPIISEEEMRANRPDYLLVLPWTFISAIAKRESAVLNLGTQLMVPLPELSVFNP